MIAWMAYAAAIGGLLAAGGWACERLCETMGWPRRFPWLVALTLAVVIPLTARPSAPMAEAPVIASPAVEHVVGAARNPGASIPGPMLDRLAAISWGAASLATLLVFGASLGLMTRSRRRWPRWSAWPVPPWSSPTGSSARVTGPAASQSCTSASTPTRAIT